MVLGGCYEIWGHFRVFFGQNGQKTVFLSVFRQKNTPKLFFKVFAFFLLTVLLLWHSQGFLAGADAGIAGPAVLV